MNKLIDAIKSFVNKRKIILSRMIYINIPIITINGIITKTVDVISLLISPYVVSLDNFGKKYVDNARVTTLR
ncbi:hypothetical protein OkiPb01307_02990 [Escherichia coli]|nr:hypothetical protein JNE151685_22260 [Escherichia coli]